MPFNFLSVQSGRLTATQDAAKAEWLLLAAHASARWKIRIVTVIGMESSAGFDTVMSYGRALQHDVSCRQRLSGNRQYGADMAVSGFSAMSG